MCGPVLGQAHHHHQGASHSRSPEEKNVFLPNVFGCQDYFSDKSLCYCVVRVACTLSVGKISRMFSLVQD